VKGTGMGLEKTGEAVKDGGEKIKP
jgi:hypothetical protein